MNDKKFLVSIRIQLPFKTNKNDKKTVHLIRIFTLLRFNQRKSVDEE